MRRMSSVFSSRESSTRKTRLARPTPSESCCCSSRPCWWSRRLLTYTTQPTSLCAFPRSVSSRSDSVLQYQYTLSYSLCYSPTFPSSHPFHLSLSLSLSLSFSLSLSLSLVCVCASLCLSVSNYLSISYKRTLTVNRKE